jgi:type I restriction enzyme M protein
VNLKEIKENDYNLNIPRYIDTFEEEEEIDINAVATKIIELKKESVKINEKIRSFCIEL